MKRIMPVFLIILLFCCTGCQKEKLTVSDFMLNTYVSITVYGEENAQTAREALKLGHEYEQIFSRTIPDSDLSFLNSQKYLKQANEELYDLISTGLYYCELTDGALDISIEPLTSLWNVTSENPVVPSGPDIQSALSRVNYKNIFLSNDGSISLENDASIDLGAIAKGYIADKIRQFLIENGVSNGIINLGGNVLCIGSKPDGSDYHIAIQNPLDTDGTILTLHVDDMSVVTSGTYERYFISDDKLYHHIIDSRTGYPAENGLCSVTILSEDSVTGDCLSTACLVMGKEDALTLLNSLDNVYGILIDDKMQIYYSDGASDFLVK